MDLLSYCRDFYLSNKYLEAIMLCLEPKILNEKVEVFSLGLRQLSIYGIDLSLKFQSLKYG